MHRNALAIIGILAGVSVAGTMAVGVPFDQRSQWPLVAYAAAGGVLGAVADWVRVRRKKA